MEKTITISIKEYLELKRYEKVDKDLLNDIAEGIKDIIKGNIQEV